MRAYSQDLRDRVLKALRRGEGPTSISKRFEVSRIWVYQVKRSWERDGRSNSLPMGGHRISCVAAKEQVIRSWIIETPDITLREMCQHLKEMGINIKESGLWHQLNKWGLSYKKNSTRQRTRTPRC